MYSHVFAIRFNSAVSDRARVRFLAELFELPVANGDRASEVYWCMVDHDGFAEFYSNTPHATEILDTRLREAEAEGLLIQVKPGFGGFLRFSTRAIGGITMGAIRTLLRRKHD